MSVSFTFSDTKKKASQTTQSSLLPSSTLRATSATPVGNELLSSNNMSINLDPSALVLKLKSDGNFLAEAGLFVRALSRWDEALAIEPENPVLHELRAQVLMELGEDEMAFEAAQQAAQFSPNWADAHLTLGRVFMNSGRLEDAKNSIEHALSLTIAHSNPLEMQEDQMSPTTEIEADLEEVLRLIALQQQMIEAKASVSSSKVEDSMQLDPKE